MTAFEQWANYFRENYRAFNPDEHDIAELAFDAALEHAAKIVEGGHFLHDQAPAKLFSIEVARAIRKEIAHPAPAVPEEQWITELRYELMKSKMTHNFTFSRNEVIALLNAAPKGTP